MLDNRAYQDFERQYRRSFWRKVTSFLQGESNELLEYDAVRRELPFQSQHDLGVQTIPLDKIVGSVGRYRDFDRAFLPTQRQTKGRWVNISKARYEEVELPAIDVYKVGEVYFVRDGNHRVSVARERNQEFIDAYVTEIEVPIMLTPDMDLQAVIELKNYAQFMQQTNLNRLRPDSDLEMTLKEAYGRLLSHIDAHRYYLSLDRGYEVPY
ncbi:MAG: transcriptional regulator, partial [Candidatus Promineifilaceae bacterium]